MIHIALALPIAIFALATKLSPYGKGKGYREIYREGMEAVVDAVSGRKP